MVHGMFAVKDKAADAFISPFFLPTDSMAIREFTYAAKDGTHKFCIHPHDYSLYKLGTFDDSNGKVSAFVEPLFLIAADFVNTPSEGLNA